MFIYFTYGTIGELLMTVNVLRIIYEKRPGAQLVILTMKNKALYEDVLKKYPFVRVYDARKPLSFLRLFFRRNTVIRQQTSGPTPAKILALCRILAVPKIGKVIAFDEPHISSFSRICTDAYVPFDTSVSFFENLLKLLPLCGIEAPRDAVPTFDFVEQKNELQKPCIIIHPIAGTEIKTLPLERWPAIIRQIRQKFPAYAVYITGSPADAQMIDFLKGADVEILAGKLSFHELSQALHDAALYVGVDTGVTHLASMVHDKNIVLGHNAYPTWLPTYNPSTIILTENSDCICNGNKTGDCFRYIDGKKYYRCLADISDEAILGAISEKLR